MPLIRVVFLIILLSRFPIAIEKCEAPHFTYVVPVVETGSRMHCAAIIPDDNIARLPCPFNGKICWTGHKGQKVS